MAAAPHVTIGVECANQSEIAALLQLSDEVAARLYPNARSLRTRAQNFTSPDISFFVARVKDKAVGCCALQVGSDANGELKRMIVDPDFRGRGIGLAIVQAVLDYAVANGLFAVRLEVGVRNIEAQAIYRKAGFRERGSFGSHVALPTSIFMEATTRRRSTSG